MVYRGEDFHTPSISKDGPNKQTFFLYDMSAKYEGIIMTTVFH